MYIYIGFQSQLNVKPNTLLLSISLPERLGAERVLPQKPILALLATSSNALVTSSNALVTSSDALVTSSF